MTRYLGYSSLKDFFPTMEIKPNPACSSQMCRTRQKAYLLKYNSAEAVSAREAAQEEAREEAQPVSHAENEWKIEVVPEEDTSVSYLGSSVTPRSQALAEGLQYELPASPCRLLLLCCIHLGASDNRLIVWPEAFKLSYLALWVCRP